jgi:hypothetical protein
MIAAERRVFLPAHGYHTYAFHRLIEQGAPLHKGTAQSRVTCGARVISYP